MDRTQDLIESIQALPAILLSILREVPRMISIRTSLVSGPMAKAWSTWVHGRVPVSASVRASKTFGVQGRKRGLHALVSGDAVELKKAANVPLAGLRTVS